LEGEQLRRLAALRRFAVEHSPFYRRFHSGFEGRPLNELPVLIKAIITVAPPPGAGQP
jgi:phenylacetate-coenzyme A ligase PaaK-like adenylate-forming protein